MSLSREHMAAVAVLLAFLPAIACDRKPPRGAGAAASTSSTAAAASQTSATKPATAATAADPAAPQDERGTLSANAPAGPAVAPSAKPLRIGLPGTDRAAVLGDGSRFVVVGGDRPTLAIRVGPYYVSAVNAADGKPLNKTNFDANAVYGLVPAADGRHVLFWGANPHRVMRVPPFSLWDVVAGTLVSRFGDGIDYGTRAAALSADGSRALSASTAGQPLKVWDAKSGRLLNEFTTAHVVQSVALSKDGTAALLGGGENDESVTLLDVESGREIHSLSGHDGSVTSVAFSPDETKLLSTSADGTIRLWDRATGRELRRLRAEVGVASAQFDATGRRVLARMLPFTWRQPKGHRVLQVNDLRLWDLAAGVMRARFAAEERHEFTSAGFAAGGREVVAATDYHLHRWSVPAGLPQDETTPLDEPRLPNESNRELFAADLKDVLSAGYLSNGDAYAATEDNTVTRWAVAARAVLGTHTTAAAKQLHDATAVSSDGRLAVAVSRLSERKAVVWELSSGLSVFEPSVEGTVRGAAFSPDASLVALGVDGGEPVDAQLVFFRTSNGTPAGTIAVPGCALKQIAFAPDGNTVAVIGANETVVEVFELDTAKRVRELVAPDNTRVEEIAFSAGDGSRLLASNFENAIVWDVASSAVVFHRKEIDDLTTAAISPDGRRVLIADKESNLNLWDVDANAPLAVLDNHRLSVTSVAFSPDGKTAISASRDQTVRCWRLPDAPATKAPATSAPASRATTKPSPAPAPRERPARPRRSRGAASRRASIPGSRARAGRR
jgi:WD40 repeat protein